ncbi:hypothetical protein LPJ81_003806 [Coemansia sp. IMI 209127]|nr:hypothetical protein LPJ81_003806 [Coemansia sp. IMI 209127]
MRSFSISHKGEAKEFILDETATVGELRAIVADAFGVEPQNQRLLLKGGNFTHDSTMLGNAIPTENSSARIVLMGTATRDIEKFKASTARRVEGQANRHKYMATVSRTPRTAQGGENSYGFLGFEPLAEFADKARALAMLHKLAADEGVKQVMKKHEYVVGTLRELHPAEKTILGYNRNRGQVIALRLRTDSLDGFRDYGEVRRVLMHELAHIVWDEHDVNFRTLNSQLCREVVELDWTRRGRTVGSASYAPELLDVGVDGGALGATGFVLGGEAPQLPPGDTDQPAVTNRRRELVYKAAQKRMDKKT